MQLDVGPNTLPIDPFTHVGAQGIRRVLGPCAGAGAGACPVVLSSSYDRVNGPETEAWTSACGVLDPRRLTRILKTRCGSPRARVHDTSTETHASHGGL